jgi:chromosome partitioning protein
MHDTRTSLSNEVRADIDRFLQSARGSNSAWSGAEILPTFVRRNIKLAEAPSYGQTIFEYDPTCNGAEDYGKVAKYLLGAGETPKPQPAATAHRPTPELQTDSPATEPAVATPAESQSDSPAEVPPAGPPQNESPAQAPVVPAPPIPIVSVNLPAPRCYSPVPIGPEPTASESGPAPVEPPK